MTEIISSFSEISHRYEAVFCDLWGVVHNGVTPFPQAVEALRGFQAQGGAVLLLTNAPRAKSEVVAQLDRIGVPRDAYTEVATSGDSARAALAAGQFGTKIYHIGPDYDLPFFEPTPFLSGLSDISRVPLDQAEGIVVTGLIDDVNETPDDYAAILLEGVNRGLKLLCANPDLVVDHGTRRRYCAGALAAAYTARGGQSFYFGKPHAPIYDLARNRLTHATGRVIADSKILCIGDGVVTDVPGALGEGLDCLFVSGGLAAEETGTLPIGDPMAQPDRERLSAFLAAHQMGATASIGHFR